jgi:hypothetical protein
MKTNVTIPAVLQILSAILGVVSLLPMALGMAGIGSPLFPLASALTFLVFLCGPLLSLAAGLNVISAGAPRTYVLAVFWALLAFVGFLLFWRLPGHGLIGDWMAMAIIIVLVATMLPRPWLWAVIGGALQCLLLGFDTIWSIGHFFSSSTPSQFPTWAPIWFLGCLFAFVTAVLAFLRRDRNGGRRSV